MLCAAVAIAPPRSERAIRIGGALAATAVAAAWAIDTPLGSNVLRLSSVFALPLLVGTLWETRRLVLLVLATIALAWQWSADAALSVYDASPTLHAQSFYLPLVQELNRRKAADGPFRTEVVPLREHWETRWIPPGLPIARGWERQLDVALNPRLYDDSRLTGAAYRRWLQEQGDRLRRARPGAVRQGRAQGGGAAAFGARQPVCASCGARRTGSSTGCRARARSRARPPGSPRSARTPCR